MKVIDKNYRLYTSKSQNANIFKVNNQINQKQRNNSPKLSSLLKIQKNQIFPVNSQEQIFAPTLKDLVQSDLIDQSELSLLPRKQIINIIKNSTYKLKQYQCKIYENKVKMTQLKYLVQEYEEGNKKMLKQSKDKIKYFEEYVLRTVEEANRKYSKLQYQLNQKCQQIDSKNQKIIELTNTIKQKQIQLQKIKYWKQNSQENHILKPKCQCKFTQLIERQNQISFGIKYNQLAKKNQQLIELTKKLKKDKDTIKQQYQQRIHQKQKIIKKMSQFNNQICQQMLKQRNKRILQQQQLTLKIPIKMYKQKNQLMRVCSEKQIKLIQNQNKQDYLILEQQNLYLKKQVNNLQKQKNIILDYLNLANQKIKAIENIIKQKDKKFLQFIKYFDDIICSRTYKDNKQFCSIDQIIKLKQYMKRSFSNNSSSTNCQIQNYIRYPPILSQRQIKNNDQQRQSKYQFIEKRKSLDLTKDLLKYRIADSYIKIQ